MKLRLVPAVAALAAGLALPVAAAPAAGAATAPAAAAAYVSAPAPQTFPTTRCAMRQIRTDKRMVRVSCNPPGRQFRYQVRCESVERGKKVATWRWSGWGKDGLFNYTSCGAGRATALSPTVQFR